MRDNLPKPYPRNLRSVSPLQELHREMDRLLDSFFPAGSFGATGGSEPMLPRIDMRESDNELLVTAEVPGIQACDVDVRLEGDVLTISGEKKSEGERDTDSYHVMERSYGRYRRTLQLPFAPDADQVRAECEHGVLTVRMRKPAQQQERSRRIEVHGGSSGATADGAMQAGQQPSAGGSYGVASPTLKPPVTPSSTTGGKQPPSPTA